MEARWKWETTARPSTPDAPVRASDLGQSGVIAGGTRGGRLTCDCDSLFCHFDG